MKHQLAVLLSIAALGAGEPAEWWKRFRDPQLDALIARAANRNRDLKLAAARVAEARAMQGVEKSSLLPTLGFTNAFNKIRGGYAQGVVRANGRNLVSAFETNSFQAGFDSSWELDFFGRNRKGVEAARADFHAAEEAGRDALVTVEAEVARNYTELRGLERRLEITRRNIATQKETLELTRARAEAGITTQLDVERQIVQLATTQAIEPALETERLLAVERLSVLIDEPAGALEATLAGGRGLPTVPAITPDGVPSDLLERRPDLRRASADIAAASARVGAARAELYPKFVITGLTGRQSTDLAGFTVGAGNFFTFGPGIQLPIFNGGRIRANIAVRDARLQQAIATYEGAVLRAVSEVRSALIACGREEQRRDRLTSAVNSSRIAVELANELYARGLSDFLTVLDAQRAQLAAEDDLVVSETAVVANTIALFKSLGGGWDR